MAVLREPTTMQNMAKVLFEADKPNKYRLTPFIITFCEGTLTDIDIQNYIEAGLRIVRFRMSHYIRKDKLTLMAMLKSAIKQCCKKYDITAWPIAIMLDLPNACIRTGYICEELMDYDVHIIKNSIVELTSDMKYWDKCDANRIFIDDPYTMKHINPETQITINFGTIRMVCRKVVNSKSILCQVTAGGRLGNAQFVSLRNTKLRRPAISKYDRQLISFVKDLELDAIMINSIRSSETIKRVRNLFDGKPMPFIMSSICDEEGLNNIDSIIAESDGIVLAREFLANAITNSFRMPSIQLNVCSKCKHAGKPFYISGSILEDMLQTGKLYATELSDVTNAILQGSGLMLRTYADATNVLSTMRLLNDLCKTIEPITMTENYLKLSTVPQCNWPQSRAVSIPSCAFSNDHTAMVCCGLVNLWSNNPYSNVPMEVKNKNSWEDDMKQRVQQAVKHCLKYDYLKYNRPYVVLRKSKPTSSYCDEVSIWKVRTEMMAALRC